MRFVLTILIFCPVICFSQEKEVLMQAKGAFNRITKRVSKLNQRIEKSKEKVIKGYIRQERRLLKKLQNSDSLKAKVFMNESASFYSILGEESKVTNSANAYILNEYIPYLDTLTGTLEYYSSLKAKDENVMSAKTALSQYQNNIKELERVNKLIEKRSERLAKAFRGENLHHSLKKINKEVFYYSESIKELKSVLKDKTIVENKFFDALKEDEDYKAFMGHNSMLAKLFRVPENYGSVESLNGLQTKSGVLNQIQQRFGSMTPKGSGDLSAFREKVQFAQGEIRDLKNKAESLKVGGPAADKPDFKPNSQRTKSFWKRVEYGFNVQTQKANGLLPSAIDLGVSMGYKLNDWLTSGVGVSYKLGLGEPVKNISLSHEGVGLRSFTDVLVRKGWWISAGYERNFLQSFSKAADLYKADAWQQSGLIGVSKKIKGRGKRTVKMQLLWDFLSYQQIRGSEPLKFRIEYNLKK